MACFSFTAAEIPSAVNRYDLPPSVRTYAMNDGSLANVHFIGIPFNAAHFEEATVVVDFCYRLGHKRRKCSYKHGG